MAKYLNVGCGNTRIKDAINIDIADNKFTDVDVIGSVLSLPFEDCSFEGIIMSHVLEHLTLQEHSVAIGEVRRVLVEGGQLYIEVPDFEQTLRNYLDNYQGKKDYWYNTIFGRRIYEGDEHKSGITHQYLSDLLFGWGFACLEWRQTDRDIAVFAVTATKKPWDGRSRL